MGMSDDFPEALEAGSNMIRIGTSIFGVRPQFKRDNNNERAA